MQSNDIQNMFRRADQPPVPGRVITRRSIWRAPLTGRTVELITNLQTYDVNGLTKTEEIDSVVVPPLDDGTTPSSTAEIRECTRCLSLISVCNTFVCDCGRTFCLACGVDDEMDDMPLCIECYENGGSGLLAKLWKWLWR
jgi:hypothetical protein